MGRPNKATLTKRDRERSQQEKRKQKLEDKALRKDQKKEDGSELSPGEDPDLIGIYPGPQPVQDL